MKLIIFHSVRHIIHKNDLQMLLAVLCLIGCGCSQSGTLRTAGHLDLWGLRWGSRGWLGVLNWNQLKRSRCCRCCCCCCCRWWWKGALHQPGTRAELVCLAGGRGERPASPAAGRTEAPCSCTSCCRDAPCLCCCRERKQIGGEELERVYESVC